MQPETIVPTVSQFRTSARILIWAAEGISAFSVAIIIFQHFPFHEALVQIELVIRYSIKYLESQMRVLWK